MRLVNKVNYHKCRHSCEREREVIRKNRTYLIIRQIADDCALVAVRAARRYLKLFLSFFLFLFLFCCL
jgi:hypothetical protein